MAHASEVADHLARAFPELSTADWLLGPHHVLGTVGGHLDLIQQLLPNLAGPKRVRLLGNLSNEIGSFQGSQIGEVPEGVFWLRVQADGSWTVTVRKV